MWTSTRTLSKAVPTSLLALSALLGAAPAVANAAPDSTGAYLTSLNNHHINYSSTAQIVQIGTTLCHELRNDLVPPPEAISRIQNFGYSDGQANVIAASAVLSFCPDMDADIK